MTYIADLKQGVVREKGTKTFGRPDHWNTESEAEHNAVEEAHLEYQASLKTYPILPGDHWVDGWEYPESWIEIEKKLNDLSKKGDADEYDYYARLKQQPIETQQDLWKEIERINDNGTLMPSERMERYLKSFSITRK